MMDFLPEFSSTFLGIDVDLGKVPMTLFEQYLVQYYSLYLANFFDYSNTWRSIVIRNSSLIAVRPKARFKTVLI